MSAPDQPRAIEPRERMTGELVRNLQLWGVAGVAENDGGPVWMCSSGCPCGLDRDKPIAIAVHQERRSRDLSQCLSIGGRTGEGSSAVTVLPEGIRHPV